MDWYMWVIRRTIALEYINSYTCVPESSVFLFSLPIISTINSSSVNYGRYKIIGTKTIFTRLSLCAIAPLSLDVIRYVLATLLAPLHIINVFTVFRCLQVGCPIVR